VAVNPVVVKQTEGAPGFYKPCARCNAPVHIRRKICQTCGFDRPRDKTYEAPDPAPPEWTDAKPVPFEEPIPYLPGDPLPMSTTIETRESEAPRRSFGNMAAPRAEPQTPVENIVPANVVPANVVPVRTMAGPGRPPRSLPPNPHHMVFVKDFTGSLPSGVTVVAKRGRTISDPLTIQGLLAIQAPIAPAGDLGKFHVCPHCGTVSHLD
jgi:hypothetical protein